LLLLTATLLAGCGNGGPPAAGATTPGTGTGNGIQTITGTAASGNPLVGAAVTAKDSTGLIATGKTAADGTFSIVVTGMTPPFMLVAVPVSGSNLYSVLPAMDMTSTNTQNVNITTVTTLVMYELNGGADPATMYNGLTFNTVTAGAVTAKETVVRSKLPANSVNPVFSMMNGKFVAQAGGNDPYDTLLDTLGPISAISSAGVTLSSMTYTSTASAGSGASGSTSAGPSITLKLTDTTAPFAVRTSISTSSPALLTATVTDSSGAPVPNTLVSFTAADPLYGVFAGGSNTALTDSSGVASLILTTPNTSGGASTVSASATVAGTTVQASLNFAVGGTTLSLSAITVAPAGALSAYGTASISVNVLSNNTPISTPMTVNFSSACVSSGKATLTPSVTTVNGTATASYLDNGCGNSDSITATLAGGPTVYGNLTVLPPNVGSIQFVSVVPAIIALKGTGGTGRSESATVTFRVLDTAGNPKGGVPVTFDLSSRQGGLSLGSDVITNNVITPGSVNSDPATGNAVTTVQSGNVSTAVLVTATAPGLNGATLSSVSDTLIVSTGIASQDNFSLGASAHNIEGWNIDGTTTTLTVSAADHFHNPVPDGTAVAFTSDGGAVLPGCTTVGGKCTSVLTSQALRPSNGRVMVLARATGEEAFTDLNGDGVVNTLAEMVDTNGYSTDMGDAFVDINENGVRDTNEPFFDFNRNGYYTAPKCLVENPPPAQPPLCPALPTPAQDPQEDVSHPSDGLYRGLLCDGDPLVCSTQKSIDVRASQVIVFSTSTANITINGGITPIALPHVNACTTPLVATPKTFPVTVVDLHGNAMPAGTTVAFSTTNGIIDSAASYTVPDTIGCRAGNDPNGVAYVCPAHAGSANFGDIPVTMHSDACLPSDQGSSGTLTVKVTSPSGIVTTSTADVTD